MTDASLKSAASPIPTPAETGGLSLPAQLQATGYLSLVALRRLFFSRQTMISLLLLSFAVLVAFAWSMRRERSPGEFTERMLLPVYVSFLLPIFCLCYGSASISSDREEQTLVYLLLTPVPRPLIHLAKYGASLLLSLAWTVGGLALLCWAAGSAGTEALPLFWQAVFWSTLAYVGLFHLLSVVFRRATIIALAYAVFLETFVGNIPGIAKRVAISFYTRCMIFEAGSDWNIGPADGRSLELFLPVSGETAWMTLCSLAVVFLAIGTWQFSRREYV